MTPVIEVRTVTRFDCWVTSHAEMACDRPPGEWLPPRSTMRRVSVPSLLYIKLIYILSFLPPTVPRWNTTSYRYHLGDPVHGLLNEPIPHEGPPFLPSRRLELSPCNHHPTPRIITRYMTVRTIYPPNPFGHYTHMVVELLTIVPPISTSPPINPVLPIKISQPKADVPRPPHPFGIKLNFFANPGPISLSALARPLGILAHLLQARARSLLILEPDPGLVPVVSLF